jgi:glycosyltransferase involved in cell wall biosynthesis
MLPLHGISYVLDAAQQLKDKPIVFHLIGGKSLTAHLIQEYIDRGCQITYQPWIPFEALPHTMAEASLCLGGPFGGTGQAQTVITGKTYQFLSMGRPTLVGENQETSMFFHNRMDSLVVPQADAKALTNTIEWAYTHPKELRQIGTNGHKLYEQRFSVKHVSGELGKMLKQNKLI